MSFGARAMTDFGLIGEGTGTAGAAVRPNLIDQAEFHGIDKITLGPNKPDSTNGITVFNAGYNGFKNLKLALWNYYADDISNNLYAQADYTLPVKSWKLKLGGQYLYQKDVGDNLAGDLNFRMWGLKAVLAGKGWSVFGAFNHSGGDTKMLNAWGGDPGYTSMIFSRNQYRESVDAFQVGFQYKILKNLMFKAAYSKYKESETDAPARVLGAGSSGFVSPQKDADELDLVLVYKPVKKWMIKLFYANRTSEYDSVNGKDLTQRHTRLVTSYSF
jgi:hypothetical protein